MALAISALFITFVSMISFATLSYFEADFRNTLAKEQFSLVSSIASNIEEKIKIAQNILIASAGTIPSNAIKDPAAAQRFLDAQKGLHTLFDNGLFLISKEGNLIAESPYLPIRRGANLSFREYFQQTVATRKPYISQPYLATHHPGEPVLAMTVPILNDRGELVAILQGSFLLLGKNIFANLLNIKNGQTGYLYLCDKNRMMILHPNRDRILKPGQALGTNNMLDKAVEGFEGSGETVTSFGGKMFVTFIHVNPTGWILGSNYPIAEAYAPFYRARFYFIVGVIATTGLVLILVWFLMKRFTNPLLAITRHVKTLPSKLENHRTLGISTNDEIGELAKAFDAMTTALAVKENELQGSELNFRALAENANDGMLIAEMSGAIVYANERMTEITGYENFELLSLHIEQLIVPEEFKKIDDIHSAVFTGTEAGVYETTLVCKDRTRLSVEVSNALTTWAGEMVDLLIVRDISERKQAETELRIASVAFESKESMVITNAEGVILRVNKAFTDSTGYTAEEAMGLPRLFNTDPHSSDFNHEMWETLQRTGTWRGEVWDRRKNGEEYPKLLTISAVKGNNGVITNYVGTHTDITERKAAEEKIQNLAFYDPLTNLPNRRLLMDRLQQAVVSRARRGNEGALLFIDLDNFKTLNDTLGHDIGDLLLQQIAQRLQSCIRKGDTVARLGGDEFVVILEDLSEYALEAAAQTKTICEKILTTVSQPYRLATHEHRSTSSIGATLFSGHHQAIEELLKQADIAMYQAKNAGRNTYRFFDPQTQSSIKARASLEGELRKALDTQQFQLYYQIQVDNSNRPLGAEALIRWLHPERGLVLPLQFIPLAEETGLIRPIGQWVLETACAQLKTWQQAALTRELVLSVNVSANQFLQPDFVAQVHTMVQRYAINPRLLKLELTESMMLTNIEDTIATMNALKKIGVHFSLDDFGTGYSSLQYLKRLPLDQLKVDRSFVSDIVIDSGDNAIVRTIIAMAQSLNLSVIAEGVETEEQRQLLLSSGCTNYQGYLFSKPVPIDQFETLLRCNQKN